MARLSPPFPVLFLSATDLIVVSQTSTNGWRSVGSLVAVDTRLCGGIGFFCKQEWENASTPSCQEEAFVAAPSTIPCPRLAAARGVADTTLTATCEPPPPPPIVWAPFGAEGYRHIVLQLVLLIGPLQQVRSTVAVAAKPLHRWFYGTYDCPCEDEDQLRAGRMGRVHVERCTPFRAVTSDVEHCGVRCNLDFQFMCRAVVLAADMGLDENADQLRMDY